MGERKGNWFEEECKRRQLETEQENLKKCEKYLGKDYTNVCGVWAMKVCAREDFLLAGPYRYCFRRSCRCQFCRHLAAEHGHSGTQTVHESCSDDQGRDAHVAHAGSGNVQVVHAAQCNGQSGDAEGCNHRPGDAPPANGSAGHGPGQETSPRRSPKVNCTTDEDEEFTWEVPKTKDKKAPVQETSSWKRRRRRLKLKAVRRLAD